MSWTYFLQYLAIPFLLGAVCGLLSRGSAPAPAPHSEACDCSECQDYVDWESLP